MPCITLEMMTSPGASSCLAAGGGRHLRVPRLQPVRSRTMNVRIFACDNGAPVSKAPCDRGSGSHGYPLPLQSLDWAILPSLLLLVIYNHLFACHPNFLT